MSRPIWSVPVHIDDVPEGGRHFDMVADDTVRAALAKAAGIVALPSCAAHFDVTRHAGDGLRVTGRLAAHVQQTCIVTLDPVESDIAEEVDLVFLPDGEGADESGGRPIDAPEPPEHLVDGRLDLGALATEFLILGIDPYPRKPGAEFVSQRSGDDAAHPFAALAALKKDGGAR